MDLLFVLSLFAQLSKRNLLCNQIADDTEEDAGKDREDHIGGIMDIQVHTGESDQNGKNQGRNTHQFAVDQQDSGSFKGSNGMSGGEGKAGFLIDQQVDGNLKMLHLKVVRTHTANSGLQDDVADQQADGHGKPHAQAGSAVFAEEQEQGGAGHPEDTGITE